MQKEKYTNDLSLLRSILDIKKKKQGGSLSSRIKTQTRERNKIVKDLLRTFHFQKTAT